MLLAVPSFHGWFLGRDNAKLVSCGADRQIFYWDVASGRVIRKFRGHNSEVTDQSSIDVLFLCDY